MGQHCQPLCQPCTPLPVQPARYWAPSLPGAVPKDYRAVGQQTEPHRDKCNTNTLHETQESTLAGSTGCATCGPQGWGHLVIGVKEAPWVLASTCDGQLTAPPQCGPVGPAVR